MLKYLCNSWVSRNLDPHKEAEVPVEKIIWAMAIAAVANLAVDLCRQDFKWHRPAANTVGMWGGIAILASILYA